MRERVDLGSGFWYSLTQWAPDWSINTRHPGEPKEVNPCGIVIWRLQERTPEQVVDEDAPEGMVWAGVAHCWFDTPEVRKIHNAPETRWQLLSLTPLHIEPSIQMYKDGNKQEPSYHGFIRNGQWVPA